MSERSSDSAAEFAAAVSANDTDRTRRVLAQHPELTSRIDEHFPPFHFGGTALLAAVSHGNRELIDVLLDAGANINQKSHWWAGGFGVLDGDATLAPYLIERGAYVDVHAAAHLGMIERLDELVSADPELVHARGGDGRTPLHVAPSVEVARYLVEHGADIDARDIDHESTPAQHRIGDRQDVVRFLVERGCTTDILMASALGDAALVRAHLALDPSCIYTSVSAKYFPMQDPRAGGTYYIWSLGQNMTAHTVARAFGHDDIVDLLLEHSPAELRLAMAAELHDEQAFNTILASHAGVIGSLSEDARRRLPDAAREGNGVAVRMMLTAGWPIDAIGQDSGTALHWASFLGDAEMVREILRHEPPLELKDENHGGTALGWALYGSVHSWNCRTGDYAGIVRMLLAAGAHAPPLTDELDVSDAVRDVLRRV